jgi:uncharacterized protein (TIGR02996 family)
MSDVGARLLTQILESPRDLLLRQIYADHLLDLGDPRGELISLQLASRDPDPDRVAFLIATYGRSWIGPLESWVKFAACKFAEGFLSEVALSDPERDLAPLFGDPIWATVETLHLGKISRARAPGRILRSVSALIATPVMRSLTAVTVGDGESLMIERDHDGALSFVPRFR